jgi:hypothetical protein
MSTLVPMCIANPLRNFMTPFFTLCEHGFTAKLSCSLVCEYDTADRCTEHDINALVMEPPDKFSAQLLCHIGALKHPELFDVMSAMHARAQNEMPIDECTT